MKSLVIFRGFKGDSEASWLISVLSSRQILARINRVWPDINSPCLEFIIKKMSSFPLPVSEEMQKQPMSLWQPKFSKNTQATAVLGLSPDLPGPESAPLPQPSPPLLSQIWLALSWTGWASQPCPVPGSSSLGGFFLPSSLLGFPPLHLSSHPEQQTHAWNLNSEGSQKTTSQMLETRAGPWNLSLDRKKWTRSQHLQRKSSFSAWF